MSFQNALVVRIELPCLIHPAVQVIHNIACNVDCLQASTYLLDIFRICIADCLAVFAVSSSALTFLFPTALQVASNVDRGPLARKRDVNFVYTAHKLKMLAEESAELGIENPYRPPAPASFSGKPQE